MCHVYKVHIGVRWEDNATKISPKIGCKGVDRTDLAVVRGQGAGACEHGK